MNRDLLWLGYDTTVAILGWILSTASTVIGNAQWVVGTSTTAATVLRNVQQVLGQQAAAGQ